MGGIKNVEEAGLGIGPGRDEEDVVGQDTGGGTTGESHPGPWEHHKSNKGH